MLSICLMKEAGHILSPCTFIGDHTQLRHTCIRVCEAFPHSVSTQAWLQVSQSHIRNDIKLQRREASTYSITKKGQFDDN